MEAKDLRVAWIMNAYRKPEQIIHLIDRICGPNDTVWLHYDKKSPKTEFEFIKQHYKKNARINCFQRYRIYWGGFQIVLADVFLGKHLLNSKTSFDYVIHITGTTYPISTDLGLRQHLISNYGKSFIKLDPNEEIHTEGSQRSQFFAKEHFGVTPGRNIPRYDWKGKLAYKINLKKLRLLNRLGITNAKVALPDTFPKIYRGFVHNIIFKDHYLAAFNHQKFGRFLSELKYTSCPDEVFFNTLLVNIAQPASLIRTDNLLVTYWGSKAGSPDDLVSNDIPKLLATGQFFARKLESKALMEELDRALN